MIYEIDKKNKIVDFAIVNDFGNEIPEGMYFAEVYEFFLKVMNEMVQADSELHGLLVDYDRQANEFKRCVCEGEFPHFEVLFRSRMEELDRQMAKFEGS